MSTSAGTISIDLELNDSAFDRALAAAETKAATAGKVIDSELSGATSRTEARFASFGSIATKALLVTGAAAGVAGVAAVKMAGDFEQSLNVFQSVSGATAKQMALVAQRARELGKDATLPGISARDAAVALTELAKAGLTVNDSLAASKGVLSLAKAGNLAVADAASIAAQALNAFGLGGDKATQVADVLAAAANASSGGVSDFALALQQASASASRLKVPLADTVTALALFSNNGINGSDAGTSLKTMFANLIPTTKAQANAMHDLGLNFFDAQGNFIGLEKTANLLQTKLGKLSQEQRELAINTIFGSDASRAAGILAKEGAKGFDSMSTAVNRQGAATKLAAAQNSGFNGALDNLISTLQTIGTDLGTKVLPPITQFLRVLAQQLPPVVDFAIAHGEALATVALAIAGGFAAIRLTAFITDLSKANKTLALFIGAKNAAGIRGIGLAMASMGRSAVAGFAAIRVGLSTVRGALLTTGIGALIVGLGLAAELIIIHWDKVSAYFSGLATRLQPFLSRVSGAFDALSETVGRIAAKVSSTLQPAFDQLAKALDGGVGQALAFVLDIALKVARVFSELLVKALVVALDWLAKFLNAINDVIRKLEAFAKAAHQRFDEVSAAASSFGSDVGDKIKAGFGSAVDFVVKGFERMVEALKPWQQNFKGTLIKTLDELAKKLIDYDVSTLKSWAHWIEGTIKLTGDWATSMSNQIGTSVSGFATKMAENAKSLADAFSGWMNSTIIALHDWGAKLLTDGGTSVSNFIDSILKFFSDLPKNIGDRLEGIVTTISNFFTGLPDRISKGLSDSGTRASGSFLDGITGFLKSENTIRKIGDTIVGAFALVLASIAIYLIDTGLRIDAKIIEGISRGLNGIAEAGKQIVSGLTKGISDNAGAVVNKIKEICANSLDAVKKFFGIHSPSTVMAGIGENLMKGLAEGISKAGSLATDSMTGVSADLQNALSVPSGSFNLSADGSAVGAGAGGSSQTFNNVYNVFNQVDASLIANDTAWRAKRA